MNEYHYRFPGNNLADKLKKLIAIVCPESTNDYTLDIHENGSFSIKLATPQDAAALHQVLLKAQIPGGRMRSRLPVSLNETLIISYDNLETRPSGEKVGRYDINGLCDVIESAITNVRVVAMKSASRALDYP